MMVNPRQRAVEVSAGRSKPAFDLDTVPDSLSAAFGTHVFGQAVMKKMLPSKVYKNVERAMAGKEKLKPEFADAIALAMKDWAISHGATHYTHWFLPLTGASAEKHDSFIDWDLEKSGIIERFGGAQLLQGEPDASSFPSGRLRSTFEARGYTGWDPSSPAFIWTAGDGVTLCIPSVFFSWTGEALDHRIPLLRSNQRLEKAALRLLKLTGEKAESVVATLGLEQEYFVIDRALRNLRPDLVVLGKTVFGSAPPKGQELQDHYFGSVKDRILQYMRDFEMAAIQLGIPVKTRHNEVAPAQHEIATVYEEATLAVDHNIMLMELMRQLAEKHGLACLLHEKPFHGLNGSGKHMNWSLATDTGLNLLSPSQQPEQRLRFIILLVAIVNAVHRHADLLRASIGSAGNDCRLGGHEAPPAIVSVYLGEELESILSNLEAGRGHEGAGEKGSYDLGIPVIPKLPKDHTDRNRTSPFAFTGSKFEFRAVGSACNVAEPATVINTIVAESLEEILDEVERKLGGYTEGESPEQVSDAVMLVLVKYLQQSKPVRFSGDNYSQEWEREAERRKLPNVRCACDACDAYLSPRAAQAYAGVLSSEELKARHWVHVEQYANKVAIETGLTLELFQTMILPGALAYQKVIADSILATRDCGVNNEGVQRLFAKLSTLIDESIVCADKLRQTQETVDRESEMSERAKAYAHRVLELCDELRMRVDALETLVCDECWPLPKYRELLFFV